MSAVKDFFSVSIEIRRIWDDLPHDEACRLFDAENLTVADVRQAAGKDAGECYTRWLLRRIP